MNRHQKGKEKNDGDDDDDEFEYFLSLFFLSIRKGKKHSIILRTQLSVRVHACIGESHFIPRFSVNEDIILISHFGLSDFNSSF